MKKKRLRALLHKARFRTAMVERENRRLIKKMKLLNAYAEEFRSLQATIEKAQKIDCQPSLGHRYK